MQLEGKVALIYGAGGSIGSAVAHAFAQEGASLFLAGRTRAKLDKLARSIKKAPAGIETAELDALDEAAVDAFVNDAAKRAGRIDISFNLIGIGDVQKPLTEISGEDFLQPIVTAMRSHFLTTRAAVRHMVKRKSGVILAFGGGGPQTLPDLGGFKIALDAIEGHRRQWACEVGRHNIRVVTLKTGGIPEAIPDSFPGKKKIADSIRNETLLGRAATLEDVGNAAVFAASDQARTITSTEINISCGAMAD